MPDTPLARRLHQRSLLAEFALRALGSVDSVSIAEAAADAAAGGLGTAHAAVFERRSYGLELIASAQWPRDATGASVPAAVARALSQSTPVAFSGTGETAHGLAVQADDLPPRLLAVAHAEALDLDADDRAFFRDVAAVLRGGFARVRTEGALRESEARARSSEARAHAVLDTTVDGVLTIDERGAIQSFNPAAERIFDYHAAEVVGRNVSMLMPGPYRTHHDGYVRAYLETGRANIIGIGREVVGQRRDGSTFPMDLAVGEVVVPGVRLFTGIVRDITLRRQLERELVHSIEDERRRLGHELHDDLGQELTGIRLLAHDLSRRLGAEAPALAGDAAEIASLVHGADRKARSIARGLAPVDVDAEGLTDALAHMAERTERLFGLPVRSTTTGVPVVVSDALATHLFRISQEAVTNAARHARATRISIGTEWAPAELRLRVTDDGIGYTEAPSGATLGLGLRAMQYRARLVGGTVDLRPSPGGGTEVVCVVPLRTEAP